MEEARTSSVEAEKEGFDPGCLPVLIAVTPFLLFLGLAASSIVGFLVAIVSDGDGYGEFYASVLGWFGAPVPAASICASLLVTAIVALGAKLDEEAVPPVTMQRRITNSALRNACHTAAYIACGFWLSAFTQAILFQFFPGTDAATMADWEVKRATALIWLNDHFDTGTKVLVGIIALALSIAIGAFWPLGVARRFAKGLTIGVAIATATASFTFVDIDVAGTHYADLTNNLRGRMISTLEELVKVRRRAAAYHWLTDLANQSAAQVPAELWRDYVDGALQKCDAVDFAYTEGANEVGGSYQSPGRFCRSRNVFYTLIRGQLEGTPKQQPPAPADAWVPDYAVFLRPSIKPVDEGLFSKRENSDTVTLTPRALTLIQLRAIYPRGVKDLNDAEAANEELKGEATGAVTKLMTALVPERWKTITEIWTDALVDQLVTIGASDLSKRLAATKVNKGKIVNELITINAPKVSIVTPGHDQGSAIRLGMARLADFLSSQFVPASILAMSRDQLRQLGANNALKEQKEQREEAAHPPPVYVAPEPRAEHRVEL